MNQQDKINQLEAQNRALVEAMEYSLWEALTYYEKTEVVLDALSNSPVDLYRKGQEVIEAAIKFSVATSHWELNATGRVLEEAVANLQQARKERE